MTARPSGFVTFLFTDIEGSTERWDAHREAMVQALRRHDAILREAIDGNSGVVFKTIGDAFCAAFQSAPDAFSAALAAQRELARCDWSAVDGLRVRMAIHAGETDERDGDYFGPPVNRVARLLSIAHGEQIVCSEVVCTLARGHLEGDVAFLDLGRHRLKGLKESESVCQVVVPDLRVAFPALRSQGSQPNNLPLQSTSFIGRTVEAARVAEMLREHRVVTLAGAGGIGKTRLALHVATTLLSEYDDGAWFVELAQIRDPSMVAAAIASTLGLQESPQQPLAETIVAHAVPRQMLLILDNCEHVLHAVAEIADTIVRACANVRFLTTSRQALDIAGEHVYHLPTLGETASAELFTARARAADASFAVGKRDAAKLAEICRRLDGIPLAIELAAARVKLLSLKGLSERLNERFRILSGGSRTAMPRQQTLRAMIDWSYDLLDEDERTLFRRLSVFAGVFSLDDAVAVCTGDALDDIAALDLLGSLVAKSLVQADRDGDETYYRLLESTRAYADEKLAERDERSAMQRAHARAFALTALELERDWESTPEPSWSPRAARVLENLRAALVWSLDQGNDVVLGRAIVAAMRPVWSRMSPAEGRRRIRQALEFAIDGDAREVARLELAQTWLFVLGNEYDHAIESARRSIAGFTELGDERGVAESRLFQGSALSSSGRTAEGEKLLHEALDVFRAQCTPRRVGAALSYLGTSRLRAGDVPGSRPYFSEALEILRVTPGAEQSAAHISALLAEAEFQAGDPEKALQIALGALATSRARGDRYAVAFDLCNIAAYLIALDRRDEALVAVREALDIACETQEAWATIMALHHFAALAANDDPPLAARLFGYVDAGIVEAGGRRDFTEINEHEVALAKIRKSLSEEQIGTLGSEGGAWSAEYAVAAALAIR